MKKLLLFALSVAFVGLTQAQDCTPQIDLMAVTPGLNPNPPSGSVAGIPYDEVNTLVIPRQVDNTISAPPGDSIALCAIKINNVGGMPVGYTYDVWGFNTPSNTNPYDVFLTGPDTINIHNVGPITRVCIRLKNPTPPASSIPVGTDGLADRDTVIITVAVEAYAVLLPPNCSSLGSSARDTFEVKLAIKDAVYAGIDDETGFGFTVLNSYPNPAADFTNIIFATPVSDEVSINVFDAVGRNVHSFKGMSYVGENKYGLSTEDFKSGVYMYSITFKGKTISKKMVVNK